MTTLIHSFITARLDNSCSLYVGLPVGCLGQFLSSAPASQDAFLNLTISPALSGIYMLHWLPLEQRISYWTIALVWRSLSCLAQALSAATLSPVGHHYLRSTNLVMLIVSFACTATEQDNSFPVACPLLWNGLPLRNGLLTVLVPQGPLSRILCSLQNCPFAVLGSGALLSGHLERVLYNFSQ